MDHFEIKVGKVNEPARLSAIERLGLVEVGEVLVIRKDLHQEGGAMKVVAPRFQGVDNYEEFSVIDVVVSFGRRERL